jgi:toxin ParE1/3/4
MRVRYRAQARTDIDEIRRYLQQRSPSGARNVLRSIYAAIKFIAENPHGSEATGDPDVRVKVVIEYPYKKVFTTFILISLRFFTFGIARVGLGKETDNGVRPDRNSTSQGE